jgi:hypothetical protein
VSSQPGPSKGRLANKDPISIWRWTLWWLILLAALLVFYVLLTPFWMGLRALAWLADFRARRRPGYRPPVTPS